MKKEKKDNKTVTENKDTNLESQAEVVADLNLEEVSPEISENILKNLTDEIEQLQSKLSEATDKYMRLAAEYDNFRRRTVKEKENLYGDSIASVAEKWLPVLDNIDRGMALATAAESEEARKIGEGLSMIAKAASDIMNGFGIKEVEAYGKEFDPSTMEAVMHTENPDLGENVVAAVFTKGYARGEKVIRHAMVSVAN